MELVHRDEEGQGLAEYALILALIAIVAIIALIFLGGQVTQDPQHGRQLGLTGLRLQIEDRRRRHGVGGLVMSSVRAVRSPTHGSAY